MRKLILISALAVGCFASAQEGTLLVGGNVGISTTNEEIGGTETKSDAFHFSPRIGYQFTKNWTGGITAAVGTSTTSTNGIEADSNEFKIGPFIRYAQPLGESGMFAVYGDLDLGYQSTKREVTGSSSKYNGFYSQFTPALFINFKNGFGLNFSIGGLGYNSLKNDDSDASTSSFDFNFGQTLSIGISKNFNL